MSQKMSDYSKRHKTLIFKIKLKIMKENNGTGKNYSNPPESFKPKDLTHFNFIKGEHICENCIYNCLKCKKIGEFYH